jgi:hypothetical protein
MKLLRTVDGEADKKVLVMEEPAPFIIQKGAVGLEIVFTADVGGTVFLFQRDNFAEKINAEQGRFTRRSPLCCCDWRNTVG